MCIYTQKLIYGEVHTLILKGQPYCATIKSLQLALHLYETLRSKLDMKDVPAPVMVVGDHLETKVT